MEMGSPRMYFSRSVRSVTRFGEGEDGPLQQGGSMRVGRLVSRGWWQAAPGRALGTAAGQMANGRRMHADERRLPLQLPSAQRGTQPARIRSTKSRIAGL